MKLRSFEHIRQNVKFQLKFISRLIKYYKSKTNLVSERFHSEVELPWMDMDILVRNFDVFFPFQ